jgi:hypothetical protein
MRKFVVCLLVILAPLMVSAENLWIQHNYLGIDKGSVDLSKK